MAATHEIFVDLPGHRGDALDQIARDLGLPVVRETADGKHAYRYSEELADAFLTTADGFVNDRALNFEDFGYVVIIRGREAAREAIARRAWAALRAAGRYALLMTRNVERELDRFTPLT